MTPITITDRAATHIRRLMDKNDNAVGIRLGTKKYGCNGLGYDISYVEEPDPADELVEDKGVKVYVDRKSLLFILGTEMDWQEDTFNTGFTFTNPNEQGRCGCGESFTV